MEDKTEDELKTIFDFLDKDHSGVLDADELQAGLSILNLNLAGIQIKHILSLIDLNNDGTVDFEEFVRFCQASSLKPKINKKDILVRLSPYDRDKDGMIDVVDLRVLLGGEGEPLPEEDIDELIRELSVNNDGKINIGEMIDIILT